MLNVVMLPGPPIYGRFPGNLLQGTFNILMLDPIAYTIIRWKKTQENNHFCTIIFPYPYKLLARFLIRAIPVLCQRIAGET